MSDAFVSNFNMDDGDGIYESLIQAHQDLSLEQSHRLNARLVLMMANQIGRACVLKEIFDLARTGLQMEVSP